jgi:outer membrane protein W
VKFGSYTILFAVLYAATAKAQCPSNRGQLEVTASYGLISSNQVSDNFTTADNSAGTKTRTYNSGSSFVSVKYFLFNRLAVGLSGGVASEKGQNSDRVNPAVVASTYTENFATIALEFCYVYHFRKHVEVYTFAGFGPSFISTETTFSTGLNAGTTLTSKENKIKAQYTPIGICIGNRLAGFVELGLGYKGVLNAGISYKFGSSCWWKQ